VGRAGATLAAAVVLLLAPAAPAAPAADRAAIVGRRLCFQAVPSADVLVLEVVRASGVALGLRGFLREGDLSTWPACGSARLRHDGEQDFGVEAANSGDRVFIQGRLAPPGFTSGHGVRFGVGLDGPRTFLEVPCPVQQEDPA
jgi:hypothetical protein